MSQRVDEHGQPLNRYFNAKRISDRSIDELIGLCRGILADDIITEQEANFLIRWMEQNREAANNWPAKIIYARLLRMLEDDKLDAEEHKELVGLLVELTGGTLPQMGEAVSKTTSLPLDNPQPEIIFHDRCFCLTGKFISGTRKECENYIMARGGKPQSRPTMETNYLVLGNLGSRDWIHSSYGRKIEQAIEFKQRRLPISIVSEEHWSKFIIPVSTSA
jgi:NAD-dependent DNA ligase